MRTSKRCTKCGETKPNDAYYAEPLRKDGLRGACKSCVNSASSAAYAAYRPVRRAVQANYRRAHKAEAAQRRRADQARSLPTAANQGKEWTGPELELLADRSRTTADLAEALGRTFLGVQAQRRLLGIDPRKARMAGVRP